MFQARAKNSKVIIVGTHVDGIPEKTRPRVLEGLSSLIEVKYNKKGYPYFCGCVFVSNTKGDNMQVLREQIVNVATKIIDDESIGGVAGAGKTVREILFIG